MLPLYDIRRVAASAADEIEALYRAAFPAEDLVPLVRGLLALEGETFNLAAQVDGSLVGHVGFTVCRVDGHDAPVALLAPLAVAASHRNRGIARALVESGLSILRAEGVVTVFVLGDLRFYARLGFSSEDRVAPPYALPTEWRDAWQSLHLAPGPGAPAGRLAVPVIWQERSLWSP